LTGIALEDLNRVMKALHLGSLGSAVQLLQLRQVGPDLRGPLVNFPGNLADRSIERCKQLRVVRADRPTELSAPRVRPPWDAASSQVRSSC
jgi:hypothetical protein